MNDSIGDISNVGTYGDAVIPEGNVILAPLEAGVQLLGGCEHLIEVGDDGIALGLGDSNNLGDETRVEEEAVPSGDWVGANERVFSGDGVTADGASEGTGAVCLHVGRVEGSQTLEVGLHGSRQGVVGSVLGGPQSVTSTATGWASKHLERGVGWRLNFVGHL